MANLQTSPAQVFGALSAGTNDYRKKDKELVDAFYKQYNLPTDLYANQSALSALPNQIRNADQATLLALLRSQPQIINSTNADITRAMQEAYYNPKPGSASAYRTNSDFLDEFGIKSAEELLSGKISQGTYGSQSGYYGGFSPTLDRYLQGYLKYDDNARRGFPKQEEFIGTPFEQLAGQNKSYLQFATYDQAKAILENPQKYARHLAIPPAELTAIANEIVARGPAVEEDLGQPYISPLLSGEESGGQVFPGTNPTTGQPQTPQGIRPLFNEAQQKFFATNDAILKQQQELTRQNIGEDTARNIASARGEAARRGLTGGSFEGRRVGAAESAGTRATAEQLTNLAIENARVEREQITAQIERDFTLYMSELEREYNSLENYKQRAFEAGQSDKARYYESQQNQLNRDFQMRLAQYQAQVAAAQQRAAERSANKNAVLGAVGGGIGGLVQLPFLLSQMNKTSGTGATTNG